jgi:Zn-dependent peptidase ImmA (M78 family)
VEFIREKVKALVQKYGTNCPFKIAKQLGVQVQFENLGNTLGYYSKHFRIPIIHINESAGEHQKIFIGGHELGHFVLHPDANTPFLKKHTLFSTDRIEVEANTFAMELLCSQGETDSIISVYQAIEEYGIPKQYAISKSLGR